MTVILNVILFIVSSIGTNAGHILLYNTDNTVEMEAFDCIYYVNGQTVEFCRRPGKNNEHQSDFSECQAGGQKWTYRELLEHNITPWQVLWWSSSVEKTDDYASIFYNQSMVDVPDGFLCNCTIEGSFGKNCEYELLFDRTSFNKAIMIAFEHKVYPPSHQQLGSIWCYETLSSCDYGLLCLDWRNICDGQQDCMDGYDEENCDKLEFNECEDGEYRCVNGMCIDEEYWLDGKNFGLINRNSIQISYKNRNYASF